MNNYILSRLRTDAAHLLARARDEAQLSHQGVKGRFRELLIDTILIPWLPPYVSCGTGTIIADQNASRQFTQDDIIVYDRSLVPPILASAGHAPDGVFLFNSVLLRVEIKSKLTRGDIRNFVIASQDISKLCHTVQQGSVGPFVGACNLLFAYDSDAKGEGDQDYQLRRMIEVMKEQNCDPLSGIVSMICVPPYGFWKVGSSGKVRCWERLLSNTPEDNVAYFVGCVSNTCYEMHAKRQGRDPAQGLEGGIGLYLDSPYGSVPGPY
jgi:hypothetical protein